MHSATSVRAGSENGAICGFAALSSIGGEWWVINMQGAKGLHRRAPGSNDMWPMGVSSKVEGMTQANRQPGCRAYCPSRDLTSLQCGAMMVQDQARPELFSNPGTNLKAFFVLSVFGR